MKPPVSTPVPLSDAAPTVLNLYAQTLLPTAFGALTCRVYRWGDEEHLALIAGDVTGKSNVLCRVHSECLTGEVLSSTKCECKPQLDRALELIAKKGEGVVVYLRQEGRGIGLGNKIRAYALQEKGRDTVDANSELGLPVDGRSYDVAAAILKDLQVTSVELLTNNPKKISGLEKEGIEVTRRHPHLVEVPQNASDYMHTKQVRMGHLLEADGDDDDNKPLRACGGE